MKIFLLYCTFLCVFSREINEESSRQKRSDDGLLLQHVVIQLSNKVAVLEAKASESEAKLAAQQAEIQQLKAKKCYTGEVGLQPEKQQEVIIGVYHEKKETKHVTFPKPFNAIPWVAVSIKYINSGYTHLRVASGLSTVTQTGFDVSANSWADTQLFGVTLTWIACSV